MKNVFKYIVAAAAVVLMAASCEKFLDRPSEDSFTTANYYQNDLQVEQSVNYLYSSPWYDILRFYIYGSETMCGNVYMGNSNYLTLTVNGSDANLMNMSYSLWAVNAHCNTVVKNILNAKTSASQATKDKAIGEALTWKAMTYFFLVRTFGDVPIIHDNTEIITAGTYNDVYKVAKSDVYEYVIMTLEKAMTFLPKDANIGKYNRIDYYAAEALLAKVYLTKAGVSGKLNNEDLTKARDYALDVIEHSGRSLTPVYSDVFRLSPKVFQQTGENLISWQWLSGSGIWTAQNSIQSDVAPSGFSEFGDTWGGWNGVGTSLQDLFGVSPDIKPEDRVNNDDRRKATMIMFGDHYDYFWVDKGGFDMYRFYYDPSFYPTGLEGNASGGSWQSGTGANYCKHLFGCGKDHEDALGVSAASMTYQLPTHILRLSDIYLVAAEAYFLLGDESNARKYVNEVRSRAHAEPYTSAITFTDIFNERRLELSLEGDNWYDLVRVAYYDPQFSIDYLLNQRRSYWEGLDGVYKKYVTDETGAYAGPGARAWEGADIKYNPADELTTINASMFTMPFPTEDVVMNPHVGSDVDPISVNVRETYTYDF